jgi:hypothetical protein
MRFVHSEFSALPVYLLATGVAAILRFAVEVDPEAEPENSDYDDLELNEVQKKCRCSD